MLILQIMNPGIMEVMNCLVADLHSLGTLVHCCIQFMYCLDEMKTINEWLYVTTDQMKTINEWL